MKIFKKVICCVLMTSGFMAISVNKTTALALPVPRWNTVMCGSIDPNNGSTTIGTGCQTPDQSGPCSAYSYCR